MSHFHALVCGGLILLAGCTPSVLPAPPRPAVSIRSLVERQWPPPHTNRPPDTNFVYRPFTNITLEWNSYDGLVTGIVSATNLAGPWFEETNLPAAGTNIVTLQVTGPWRYFRAFNR